jgi:hypothetical protein
MPSGNTSKAGDSCEGSQESYLFLLTSRTDPGIGLPGEGVGGLEKAVTFGPLGCALDAP